MPRTTDHGFDASVLDKDDKAVVLVQVNAHPVESWAAILARQVPKFPGRVSFALAIDPSAIRLFQAGGEDLGEPIVHLDTRQILEHYDPDFSRKQVFEPYLLTLVEAWLRDLAYHWKSETPPGSEPLGKTGLLRLIAGGTTRPFG